ncbi:MAG: hypothetical protein U1E73_10200 [Planctomycetota bacterium]
MRIAPPRHRPGSPAVAALLAAFAAACSGPTVFLRRPASAVVWPPVPEPPRIELVLAYHGSDDVERHPGFWAKLGEWLAGAADHALASPGSLALDAADRLWVADAGQSAVHRIDLATGEHAVFKGSDAEPMVTPVGIAPAPDGRVFVSDSTRSRILVLDDAGEIVHAFGDPEHLGRPTGIAWDAPHQRLLVLDTVGCRVLALDAEGNLLQAAGARGTALGEYNFPTHVALAADGRVLVTDSMNFRVQVLGPDLVARSQFGSVGRGPGTFAAPKGIALDSEGHVYVADSMFDNVQVFADDGQLLLAFGQHGSGLGDLALPRGLWIDGQDRIFVCDGGNARVQIYRYLRR